jgi:hypothetical protein
MAIGNVNKIECLMCHSGWMVEAGAGIILRFVPVPVSFASKRHLEGMILASQSHSIFDEPPRIWKRRRGFSALSAGMGDPCRIFGDREGKPNRITKNIIDDNLKTLTSKN